MLNRNELRHTSIEKEAAARVEVVRKWAHFLTGRHFTIVTDLGAVSYIYDGTNRGKIKTEKILRWRMELSECDFDIMYCAGKLNSAADALSRAFCAATHDNTLHKIHNDLCHPGVTRLYHFIRVKILPYACGRSSWKS